MEQDLGREGRTELQSGYFCPPAWKTAQRKLRKHQGSKQGALHLRGTPVTGFMFHVKNSAVGGALNTHQQKHFCSPTR